MKATLSSKVGTQNGTNRINMDLTEIKVGTQNETSRMFYGFNKSKTPNLSVRQVCGYKNVFKKRLRVNV